MKRQSVTRQEPALPPPESPEDPKYWQDETGVLPPAILRYMRRELLTVRDLALIRAYLMQWVNSPVWDKAPLIDGAGRRRLARLREEVAAAKTKHGIDTAIAAAVLLGMDPL